MSTLRIPYRALESGHVLGALNKFGIKLRLEKRKELAPIFSAMRKFMSERHREKEELIFVYGKEAPASWPNAGHRVVEPTLFADRAEWESCLKELDRIRDQVFECEWDKQAVIVKAAEVATLTPEELDAAAIFFEVGE